MGKCNLKSKQELYNEIVSSYSQLKAYEVNDLASAVRDVIFTKLPDKMFSKYAAVSEFVKGKTFNELFTKYSDTLDTFAFNTPAMYDSIDSLQDALLEHGVNPLFSAFLARNFEEYRDVYLTQVAANTRSPIKAGKGETEAWYEAPLQILYGDAQDNGDFTLPDAVLFNMMVTSYRYAGSVPSMLNNKEIGELVYGNGDAKIPTDVYELFTGGGVNRNTLIMQVGDVVYRSMNIRSIIEEREDITFDPAVVDRADGLGQRIKYGLGLLAVAGMGEKVKIGGVSLFTKKVVEVLVAAPDSKGDIVEELQYFNMIQVPKHKTEEGTLTGFGKSSLVVSTNNNDVDLILGDAESSYEPSNSPIKHVKKGIRNSIFDIATKVATTIRTLQSSPWTKNSGFEIFEGAEKQTIRELVGWKDPATVHVDDRGSQEAKNAAIDREIDNLVKYNKLGRLERFFVPYKAMNTNRLVQLGPVTPQNSLLHRNLITPEGALNTKISPNNAGMFSLFRLAVAQAFDKDIDKTDLDGGLQLFNKLVNEANRTGSPLAQAIVAYNSKDFKTMNSLLLDIDAEYGAGPGILKGIPALATYIRALNGGTNFSEFTTDITLEADGVTNGFAISILQFAGGLFDGNMELTESGLRKLNQVGLTLSTQDGDMGSRFKSGFRDAYTEFGYSMKSIIDKPLLFQGKVVKQNWDTGKTYISPEYKELFTIKNLTGDVTKMLNALQTIGFDTSKDSIIRKMAKTPFMVYNYGAMFASISRELSVEVSEMFRSKVVDIQTNYTASKNDPDAKRAEAYLSLHLEQAVSLFSALALFGEKKYSPEKIKELLEAGTLIELKLDTKGKVKDNITLMYKPIVAHAAEEVLGDISKYRAAFIEAAEIQFMIFNNQLEKAVDKIIPGNGKFADKFTQMDEFQKTELIKNTLLRVYPQFKGPFAGKTTNDGKYIKDAIDLIKVKYTHQDSNIVKIPRRGGGAYSVQVRTLEFEAPGASAVIRPIQNIDSVILSLSIKDSKGGFSPIHDAMDAPLDMVEQSIGSYNTEFVGVNERFGAFAQVSARLAQSFELLSLEEQEEIQDTFYKEAFVNKGKPELFRTSLDDSMANIEMLNDINKQARSKLFSMLKEKGTKVQQMYVATVSGEVVQAAEFTSEVQDSLQDKRELQDTKVVNPIMAESIKKVLGSSPEEVLESVSDIFDNVKLSTNARKIFGKLSTYTNSYVSEKEHAEETANLERVWNDLILKVVANIEGVTISAGKVEGRSIGGYNVDTKNIRLNLSKYIASSYAEQSDQEVFTHESLHPVIHAVLQTGTPIKGALQDLQRYARKHVVVEDFLSKDEAGNVVYKTDPVLERENAQQQYDYFIGPFHTNSLGEKVPSTLEEFIVGALTNKYLVKKLTSMQQPAKHEFFTGTGFIQQLGNAISTLIDMFIRKFRKDKIPTSVHAEVFELAQQLAGAQERQRKHVYYEMSLKAKDKLYSKFSEGVKLGLNKLGRDGKSKSFIPNTAYVFANLPEALRTATTEQAFTKAFSALSSVAQESALAYLVKEATIGTTDVRVEKLLLLSKHLVESQRKHRENAVISKIQKMFLTPFKEISKIQHTALTKVLLRGDLSALMYAGGLSADKIVNLLRDPTALKALISTYELNLNIPNNQLYAQHTQSLASLITMRKTNKTNAALNANTIHLMHVLSQKSGVVSKSEVLMLDAYVSLLAIQMTPQSTLDTALEVIDKEQAAGTDNGFTFLLKHHNDFKLETKKKLFESSPIQMRKGYVANVADPHVNIVAATDAEAVSLYKQGYTKLGKVTEYDGIDNEGLSLYVTKYHVEPTKVAGVLSYTQLKASGTSVFEMFARKEEYQMVDEISGEAVPNAAKIHVAIRDFAVHQDNLAKHENSRGLSSKYKLIPIRDELSNIVDYRIELPYAKMEEIYKGDSIDMDIDKVLGRMGMHLVDKTQSEKVNKNAIDFLIKDYSDNRRLAKHEFIDLFDKKYYSEYYAGLPRSLKQLIKKGALTVKSPGGKERLSFPIRRDYVLTFFGHKRLSAANLKLISSMPRAQFAIKQFEASWQSLVALGVKNVIIKEVAGVPGANMVSNVFVSLVAGMTPLEVKKYWAAGWKNLEVFKQEAKELAEIQLELQNVPINTPKSKVLESRYFELRSSLAENPVITLINMGLFTSISEDVELREFDYLTKFANSLSGLKKNIPEALQSAARVAYMTETTQLFKELHHFTTTMDFVARYGMYQHLTIKKKLSENEALSQVFDAFVLYDKPLGPKLDYVNKMGLGLFVKFWLFIQRYLYKQAKREPANVAMLLAMQEITGVDVPDVYDSAMIFGNWLPPIGGPQKVFENVFYIPFTDQIEDITGLPVDPL